MGFSPTSEITTNKAKRNGTVLRIAVSYVLHNMIAI